MSCTTVLLGALSDNSLPLCKLCANNFESLFPIAQSIGKYAVCKYAYIIQSIYEFVLIFQEGID